MPVIRINSDSVHVRGRNVRVHIIRDSKLCRFLTDKPFLVLGNRVYYAAPRLRVREIKAGVDQVRKLYEMGFIRYYWNLLTNGGF